MSTLMYAVTYDEEGRQMAQRLEYAQQYDKDEITRRGFEIIGRMMDKDEKKLLSWDGYAPFKANDEKQFYNHTVFVLTDKNLYQASHGAYLYIFKVSKLSGCIGHMVFRGNGFEIPEFAVDFTGHSVYCLYDKSDVDSFEAEFRKQFGKYGHQDDKSLSRSV